MFPRGSGEGSLGERPWLQSLRWGSAGHACRYMVAAEQPESGGAPGSLPLARTGSSPVPESPLKPSDHAAAGEGQGLSEKPVNFRPRCK